MVGTFECSNEPSGSIKCGEFLDQLRTGQLLKKDCAPWSEWVSKEDSMGCMTHVSVIFCLNTIDTLTDLSS